MPGDRSGVRRELQRPLFSDRQQQPPARATTLKIWKAVRAAALKGDFVVLDAKPGRNDPIKFQATEIEVKYPIAATAVKMMMVRVVR